MKDGIKDTVCGYWAKRWDLEGPEYLLHFHSDGYRTLAGFELQYFAGITEFQTFSFLFTFLFYDNFRHIVILNIKC